MIIRRYLLPFIMAFIWLGCNNRSTEQREDDGLLDAGTDPDAGLFHEQEQKDSVLLALTEEVLNTIKDRDYSKLAAYFHPKEGVRFSPYGYIDTLQHVHFSVAEFLEQAKKDQPIVWGSYDGTGKVIEMSLDAYFDKFVYEVDFLNAEQLSVNEVLGKGNSLINIQQVYPGSDFTESYFSGFEEKYGGMDWRSLRLIFKSEQGRPWLVGIVHDQWTI